MPRTASALLEVRDLSVTFARGRHASPLLAVDRVSFDVREGETVGLVGESGSGKTTIGRAVLGLTHVDGGVITFGGDEITHASRDRRRALSKQLQVVFQDPYSSLNPARTIGQTLSETLRVHVSASREAIRDQVDALLARVGLPADAADRYPVQFSGGQRQRVAIARALIAQPRLVVCDEPTSALDLSVQAQILNLLQELQQEFELSYLFISHDLVVVRHVSHRIIVLYRGNILEAGTAAAVYESPRHPYTRALLASSPDADPVEQKRRRASRAIHLTAAARGLTSAQDELGCPFAGRCPYVVEVCRELKPALEQTVTGSLVSCHRWREIDDVARGYQSWNGQKSPSGLTR